MDSGIHARLARHLASLGMGYPEKEELLDILKENFTEAEAALALAIPTRVIPFQPVPAREIARGAGMEERDARNPLEALAHRGLLWRGRSREGETGYALQQFGYGFPQTFFWRGTASPLGRRVADLVVRYARKEQLEEIYGASGTKAFRYVPSWQAIDPDEHAVFPFEMMERLLRRVERIALVHCACRTTVELLGKRQCAHALANCLKYDELAEYVIDTGIGREISREEAREVIAGAEAQGLVHLVDNARDGIKHTCNCCSCCCWSVGTIARRRIPRDVLMATYFMRETDADECTGCGACVDPCPVRALTMEDGLPRVERDWCIGCGVCGSACPTKAIRLVRRSDAVPPKDFVELQTAILRGRTDKA